MSDWVAVTNTPTGSRAVGEDCPLSKCHDGAAKHVGHVISVTWLIDSAATLPLVKELHDFVFNRTAPSYAHIATVELVCPGSLITSVGDQTNSELYDGEGKRVVDYTDAVASVDLAVEQHARLHAAQVFWRRLVYPRLLRSTGPCADAREDVLSNTTNHVTLIGYRLENFLF